MSTAAGSLWSTRDSIHHYTGRGREIEAQGVGGGWGGGVRLEHRGWRRGREIGAQGVGAGN